MERWLLISNCQTFGLVNSMRLMCPAIDVMGLDVGEYRRRTAEVDAEMGDYDRVVLNHEVRTTPGADHSRAKKISDLPAISFAAYHPDLTYVSDAVGLVEGPNNHYHSMICFAAYSLGLSVDDAERLFNSLMYERSGYFDRWVAERDPLIDVYASNGMNISNAIRTWGRRDAFMYSTNHPKIRVIFDLARVFLEKEGLPVRYSDVIPHDNLVLGPCFPVYPEIAEYLGVNGSYLFKTISDYRQLDLREFIAGCFQAYERRDWTTLRVEPAMEPLFRQVIEQI